MKLQSRIKLKIQKEYRYFILKCNGAFGNFDEKIWLLGDGRSGTSWVTELINHDKKYLEMYEPFHPKFVYEAGFIEPHLYVRPQNKNKELHDAASKVFSGMLTNSRVTGEDLSYTYKGLLIKDIFANLFCYWASLNFVNVKPVLLIRNPFSVALSKSKKQNWYWGKDPMNLLNQKELYHDYLKPFEKIILTTSAKNNFILNQILIWSIINYVPLRQFKPDDIHICFYEEIFGEPIREIGKILRFVKGSGFEKQLNLTKELIDRPSRYSRNESNIISGTSPLLSWKDEIDSKIIDGGMEILECFGFDELYDDNSKPNIKIITDIQESEPNSI